MRLRTDHLHLYGTAPTTPDHVSTPKDYVGCACSPLSPCPTRLTCRATRPAVDTRRQSIPELGAYRMVVTALRDLLKAEKTLAIVQEAGPDAERAIHLNALGSAIAQLKTMIPADSQSIAD